MFFFFVSPLFLLPLSRTSRPNGFLKFPTIAQQKNILIGTKVDQRSDPDFLENLKDKGLKPVATEQGEELAADIKALKYMECSAKDGQGLKNIFDFAIKSCLCTKKPASSSKSCSLF